MRILLTGASGQVGGAIKTGLTGHHEVMVPDRSAFDLANHAMIATFIGRTQPQLIINCAAYTAVDDAERDSGLAARINGTAPEVIAKAALEAGAGLIHFSTDYVFDGASRRPYRETDACSPISSYGRTKLQGEQGVASSGVPHLIIRTSWVYGAHGKNFLLTMLRLGAERTALRVVNDQRGAPTSVNTLSSIVAAIVARMDEKPRDFLHRHGGILHAACAGETTWHGFASAIFDEARMHGFRLAVNTVEPIATSQYPTPARRPPYSVLDLNRLKQEFRLAPAPWRDALIEVMDQLAH